MFPNPPAPETVGRALDCIPANDLPHEERASIGFAVFDGLGKDGESAFVRWLMAREGFTQAEALSDWRSCCRPGPVKVGTLFTVAKRYGFRMTAAELRARKGEVSPNGQARPSQASQQAKAAAALLEEQQRHAKGAANAAELWQRGKPCTDAKDAPYLLRKGVQPYGVRALPNGLLLVPVHDASGELINVQSIFPKLPSSGGDKRFIAGARKTGGFHLIGQADGAPLILIAEGYSTGASCHAATGRPLAVAFDAGSLHHVARALRQRWPDVRLLICGDDDAKTERANGKNPGRKGAEKAQAEVSGVWSVFPSGLPDGASDFNELQAHAGPEEVRRQIEAAAAQAMAEPFKPASADAPRQRGQIEPQGDETDEQGQRPTPDDAASQKPPRKRRRSGSEWPGDGADPAADRFNAEESGLWYSPPDEGAGTLRNPVRVCGRIDVKALAFDMQEASASLVLRVDIDGRSRPLLLPMTTLAGDGLACRHELLNIGFQLPADQYRRRLLSAYLNTHQTPARVRLVDCIGWHGRSFVMPTETLRPEPLPGDGGEASEGGQTFMFHAEGVHVEARFEVRGTLAAWQRHIGARCVDNSRLAFAVCCALAGPLLKLAPSAGGGGFHYFGNSSLGKTTALRVAASVWGSPQYMQNWRATDNGLEALAAQHSDGTLILDEIKQIEGKALAEAVYMLGNGNGKVRSDRSGRSPRPPLKWRVLMLSTGETTVIEQITSSGMMPKAGQELRMLDIPAEPANGHGLFECLHGLPSGGALADALQTATPKVYGSLGAAWLHYLVNHRDEIAGKIKDRWLEMIEALVPVQASGQARRAAARFAICALAGELATEAGLLDWPQGEATRATQKICNAWIENRAAGIGASEDTKALQQIRYWFVQHGDARFTPWARDNDDHAPRVMNRAGWKRSDPAGFVGVEYCVLVDAFRTDACKGLNPKEVIRILIKRGHLIPEEGTGKPRSRLTPPGHGKASVYRIRSTIFDDTDDAE